MMVRPVAWWTEMAQSTGAAVLVTTGQLLFMQLANENVPPLRAG